MYEKKRASIILVAIIGLSVFVGLASAASGNPSIAGIFEILLRVDNKLDSVLVLVDNATRSLDTVPTLLGSYSGHFVSTSAGDGVISGAEITSDKPAIFTVTVSLSGYKDAADEVWLAQAPNKWFWSTAAGLVLKGDNDDMTFTVAGYGVGLTYRDFSPANLEVVYCIIVQGDRDTVVKVGEWTP